MAGDNLFARNNGRAPGVGEKAVGSEDAASGFDESVYACFNIPGINVLGSVRKLWERDLDVPLIQEGDTADLANFCVDLVRLRVQESHAVPLTTKMVVKEAKRLLYFAILMNAKCTIGVLTARLTQKSDGSNTIILDLLQDGVSHINDDLYAAETGMFSGEESHAWERLLHNALVSARGSLENCVRGQEQKRHGSYIELARLKSFVADLSAYQRIEASPFELTHGTVAAFMPGNLQLKILPKKEIDAWTKRRPSVAGGEHSVVDLLREVGFDIEEMVQGRGDDAIQVIKSLLRPSTRKVLERDFHFQISEFGEVDELIQFAAFLERVSIEDQERVTGYIDRYGSVFMRAFLSVAYDPRASEYILKIAEEFSEDRARAVFNKFADFADAAEVAKGAMIEIGGSEQREQVGKLIQKSLLGKATGMLHRVAEHVGSNTEADTAALIGAELDRYTVQGQMLVGTFRAATQVARAAGKVPPRPDALPGVSYERVSGGRLLSDDGARDFEALGALYRRNFPPKTGEMLANKMKEMLQQNPNAVVHRVLVGDVLAAFLLVAPEEGEAIVHVSALNVSAELAPVGVGKFLIDEVLQQAVRDGKTIVAEAEASKKGVLEGSRAEQYMKQYGFEIDTQKGDKGMSVDSDGVTIFHLILRPPVKESTSTDTRTNTDAPDR